jgi:hypothetical protein
MPTSFKQFMGRLIGSYANPAKMIIGHKFGSGAGNLAGNALAGIGNKLQGKKWSDGGNNITGNSVSGEETEKNHVGLGQRFLNSTIFNPAAGFPMAVANALFNGGNSPDSSNSFMPPSLSMFNPLINLKS